MRHLHSAVLMLTLFCMVGIGSAANLVMNPGFEDVDEKGMPENWGGHSWTKSGQGIAGSQRAGASGARCLSVTIAAGQAIYGCFSRAMDVSDLDTDSLLFSCRYRMPDTPYAQAMVVFFDQDFMVEEWKTRPLSEHARALRNSKSWQTLNWHADIPPGARQAVVVFQLLKPGTVMLDDVVLRPVPDEVRWDELDIGRVAALPAARRATFRLSSSRPGVRSVKVKLTAMRDGGHRSKAAQTHSVESDAPADVDLRYFVPANEEHRVDLEVTDATTKEILLYDQFRVPGLIDATVDVPAFRGALSSTESVPQILVSGRLFTVPGVLGQLTLSARLSGTGAVAEEGGKLSKHEDGSFELSLPTEGMLIREHQVRIEAHIGKRLAAFRIIPVRRIATFRSEVYHDTEHRLWVSGRQVFPVGIYYVMDTEGLQTVAEAGFNMAVVPSTKASYVLAENAASKGVGLIVSSPSTRRDFWERKQEKFGDMASFVGWEGVHRPDAKLVHPEVMLALYQIMCEVSPNHPVIMPLRYAETAAEYARATDVIVPWELPVPRMPITRVADLVDKMRQATEGRKPVWALIQATGKAWAEDNTLDDTTDGRMPTVAEVRALAYTSLVHGAEGLLFYAYNLVRSDKQRNYEMDRDAPELWEGLKTLNSQIAALAPLISKRSLRTMLPPAADGLVHMATWVDQDNAVAIAVNTTDMPAAATIRIPGATATDMEVMFEDRTIGTETAGVYNDVFGPYSVHVYVIK